MSGNGFLRLLFRPEIRRHGDVGKKPPFVTRVASRIIRKSKCSTDFKRNDFLKKTKRTHWVRFVHLNSLIESCVFLYLWNSPFDTFL